MMRFFSLTLVFVLFAAALATGQPQAKPPATFEISGTAVDSLTGQPLTGVHVAVAQVTARNNFRIVVTGEDGKFFFDGLARGKYALTAQRIGYLTQSFDQHGQYSTSIAVGPGQDARGLIFRVRPQASISGQVVDEHNEPVRNARVILFQQSAPGEPERQAVRGRTTTDDEGVFYFAHLFPEKYFIAVEAEPWYAQRQPINFARTIYADSFGNRSVPQDSPPQPREDVPKSPLDVAYPVTYYPGVTDPASAGSIAVTAGEKFTADIVLQPVPAIHSRITVAGPDSKQHFSGDLRQRVMGDTFGGFSASVIEISPGVLEVSGAPPGHYELNLNTYDETGNHPAIKGEIDLADGTEAGSFQVGAAPVALTGAVKFDTDEDPPTRGSIVLRNRKSGEASVGNISDHGEFEIQGGVQPGSYDVTASAFNQSLLSELIATGAKVTGHSLEIKDNTPVKLTAVLTRGLGQVTGVALRDDKPVAGIMIVLVPEDPLHHAQLFRRDQSDSDGTFTLPSVVPGKYTVLAIADGWELDYRSPDVLKPYMAHGTPIQVEDKGKYEVKVNIQ
ncbi:MAG: hypothetical protein DMG65_08960 [Candidatus Angelobacter sp. Gp1-AA117]|nr:MAG: hypothetical protein DMG65_08960 [Candidatus Angelobacter sp. Gp1-AA117]